MTFLLTLLTLLTYAQVIARVWLLLHLLAALIYIAWVILGGQHRYINERHNETGEQAPRLTVSGRARIKGYSA